MSLGLEVNLELLKDIGHCVKEQLTMREKRALPEMRFLCLNSFLLYGSSFKKEKARTLACDLGLYRIGF